MLTSIRLQHFRSYKDESFELGTGVNIIVGPNASGKTNLLEAVLVLARGTSYRARDGELIAFGKPWARLDGQLASGESRSIKLIVEPKPVKSFELEGKTYHRLTLAHSLPAVLFEPDHLELLSGSPELRRDYLDDLLEQTTTGYGWLRREYKRTLAQRNALLKKGGNQGTVAQQLFPWDVRLSQLAGQIIRTRVGLVEQLAASLPALYRKLAGHRQVKVAIEYNNRWPTESYETQLLKELETRAATDLERGFTSVGPHREDLLTWFNGHSAQDTASRGEVRTLVLALKILELQLIAKQRGTAPLLLLDDVFSELDGSRRRALTEYLAPYQTFITTTDADLILHHFAAKAQIIPLS